MRKLAVVSVSIIICLLNLGEDLYAHEGIVHDDVLTKGAVYLDTSVPPIPKGLLIEDILHGGGIQYKEVADYSPQIRKASVEEDNLLQIPFFEEVPSLSWMRHYYNPKTKEGLWSWPSTIKYGETIWSEAIWKYRHGDKENAYYKLGRVIHLLEDMSSVQI